MSSESVVHVVDDDAAVRNSLRFLLKASGFEAATYASGPELLAQAAELRPGCVLTDVRMPEMNGIELVRQLKARGVSHPVVVMTGHADVPLAIEAMRAGVVDFIEKPFDDEALLAAVRSALAQNASTSAEDAEASEFRSRLEQLTTRERQVLEGLVAGQANKAIAYDLDISPRTVEVYRANVMTKMKARSLSELVRMRLLVGKP
ncbi:MAG: response regulator [Brevundimonas sp.]|uniref:response regulator FixJ n=1 Tax=Brevundimonas sp. TaxID=1871086 RepID=UPI00181AAC87|nr:response regulator FixJ [Brevundimonas sp.]MBA4805720.1 response regulator [Brevundimonas sp.]